MEKIKVLRLGTECKDKASQLKGTLTHWFINMENRVEYLLQPKRLDDEGRPVKKIALEAARLKVEETDFEEVEVPTEILGSIVTDKASGFKGMAVEFVRHINGCFHVVIQPAGFAKKTGEPIQKCEFDLRGCSGSKVPQMTAEEKKESEETNPSPADTSFI